jgi:3-hydroxyisobutyrate dehydrogenase-like beta-hydroxyacid dehydrogenase
MTDKKLESLAFIGFGEAARAFATDWQGRADLALAGHDLKLGVPATDAPMRAALAAHGCVVADSPGAALRGVDVVFCLVTADQARAAAQAAAPHLAPGTLWFDGNSCAPQSKAEAAATIEGAGGRYVDLAIMAPVHPRRTGVPLLASGPAVAPACAVLARLGMTAGDAGDRVGQASAIKMIRSVMIKGLEALTAECLLAARRAGVEGAVLASLQASDPAIDWPVRGAYNLERMMVHGARRAAEMREVVATIAGLGLPAGMSAATAAWQDRVAALGLDAGEAELSLRAEAILSRL